MPWGQIKASKEQDWIRTLASRTVANVEAKLGQSKCVTRKRHDRAIEARTGKGQARNGRDRIMPKNNITEIENEGKVST